MFIVVLLCTSHTLSLSFSVFKDSCECDKMFGHWLLFIPVVPSSFVCFSCSWPKLEKHETHKFVTIFYKGKVCLFLRPRKKSTISVWCPQVLQSCGSPELARSVISPHLSRDAVEFLQGHLSPKELTIFELLGDGWTKPRYMVSLLALSVWMC